MVYEYPDNNDAHEALEKSESYLRAVLNHVLDGIISIDEDRVVETFNPAAERIFGYAAAEVIGQNVRMLMPEPYRSRHDSYVRNYLRTGNAKIIGIGREVRGRHKSGRIFPLDLAVSEMSVRGRRRFIGILRDITARKDAEKALRRMNEELEQRVAERTARLNETNSALQKSLEDLRNTQEQLVQTEKMAALGALVSGVAHEINTPVGVCVTAASYLELKTSELADMVEGHHLEDPRLNKYLKTATEALASISTNLNRAAELVKSFKQVAVDQTTEEKRRFNLKDYAEMVLMSLRPKYKKSGHTIELSCPDGIELTSYPGALSQIITNLLMNSLTHGFEGIPHGRIILDLSVNDEQCIVEYSDNGVGMPPEHVEKIFDPFFTTKRSRGGTGLGMHIVYNLVKQRLGGEIECTSAPGKGTLFTIAFPL